MSCPPTATPAGADACPPFTKAASVHRSDFVRWRGPERGELLASAEEFVVLVAFYPQGARSMERV